MSLLRRRMMQSSKGFVYTYRAVEGGTPLDDGWVYTRTSFPTITGFTTFSNADNIFVVNVNHGGSVAYIRMPEHEYAENCSLEIEASYENTCLGFTLSDGERIAQAVLTKWGNRYVCMPANASGAGAATRNTSPEIYYTVRIEKRGNQGSFYLNDELIAGNLACKLISDMTCYKSFTKVSVGFDCAGSWGAGDRGVAKIKKIIYKEW